MEPLPDLTKLSDAELKELIAELEREEDEISYRRRILHGKIDILRAELQVRLKQRGEGGLLEEVDLARLAEILSSKGRPELPEE